MVVIMVYIVCEGEDGKSEHSFVSAVVGYYGDNCEYEIVCACGKDNIDSKLEEQLHKVKQKDKVALFFDNIGRLNNITVWDLLSKYITAFSRKNVDFYYTTYFCFEEIFLSYSGILPLIPQDSTIQKEIKDIQRLILEGKKDYYKEKDIQNNLTFWNGLFKNFGTPSTREQFSSSLINHLLSKDRESFGVSKSKLGNCWINDCSSLQNIIWFKCRNCKYRCNHKPFSEKLKDIEKDSVFGWDEPVSVLFMESK